MDDDLMAAINAQADLAEQARPNMTDLHALAMTLNQDFDERSKRSKRRSGMSGATAVYIGGSEQDPFYWS
ncbi:hypothetical protein HGP14_33070 [Rhizobium sp. P32RR-XVIII]|uniref:hypothetical protein n=1 Tax=Rhizobium sp. P32RR-XVIII TaxID=2726738 RepID=UPI0014567C1B|nr:hypothetical protein [Rhizobium sp. P32RR-XVIII]NLS08037.1 hypothetical protein [Rhizobium sp. P32RR-XVIII]